MSIHKLTAGSGYDYLTRQVAALDATDKGHAGLASYYTDRGETPGVWLGSGIMAGVGGLSTGEVVTAEQMQNLFGAGHHPLATQRTRELDLRIDRPGQPSLTAAEWKAATRLGAPYKVYDNDVSPFRLEVARRIATVNDAAGLPGDWPVPAPQRARIRTQVAIEMFRATHGRDPHDAREIAGTIAEHSRPRTSAVSGYDLTFSPVKSVSTLWAVSDPKTAAAIERAHQSAIADALDFLEHKALFTRLGANGVRQVDVRGMVAAAFTHRDSRAGDPDLHTHVAVANKVQTLDGKWRAIDGRVLFKATVAASEVYNTALEGHLVDALRVRFQERPNQDVRKRPVREIVGVDPGLNQRFSKRRLSVEKRRTELAAQFQATHRRPPTPVETLQLAQQATLETRESKHEPRTQAEQRQAWHHEAVEVLGSARRLQQMIHKALHPPAVSASPWDSAWFATTADRVVATMEGGRATWQFWHVYAEAQRQVRAANVPTHQVSGVVDRLVNEVLQGRSVSLARPPDGIADTPELRRIDGTSMYTAAGADLFTSPKVLTAEQRLVGAAARRDGSVVDEACVAVALLESEANGVALNAGQATLVREMVTSGARLQLAIAPAGSGKTTAMRGLAQAWSEGGGTVIGLAPSAAAADALRAQLGSGSTAQADARTDTLAKLTHSLRTGDLPDWMARIDSSTLLVIDEAGMADTLSLDAAASFVLDRGGSVRLVGDDQQLAAIGAGGVLRDIQATHGALQLTELARFIDPAEGAASLALREGKTEALGFYLDRDRVHVGDLTTMTEEVFAAWQTDRADGMDSIMLAPTRELTCELNQRARAHRLAGGNTAGSPVAVGRTTTLADGNDASVGDLIITRTNDRHLRTSTTDWVKNGDRWRVLDVGQHGDLTVQHTQHGRTVRLPQQYVQGSTELGYACTVHAAQGVTADTMHGLARGNESRQQLYAMLTRGKRANHLYLEVVGDGDPHSVIHPTLVRSPTPTDLLEQMLARDGAQQSATSLLRAQEEPANRLGEVTQRYLDSLYLAAEQVLGAEVVDDLDATVEQVLPDLADEAAWPTLRAHLLLLGACGEDAATVLREAAHDRELQSARDRAAVLDWRLDASGHRNAGVGPLPWLPGIPPLIAQDPSWGRYLGQRADLVTGLADQVRLQSEAQTADGSRPAWADTGLRTDAAAVASVEVWRAAMQVPGEDRRPTGPVQLQKAFATWQHRLNRQVSGDQAPALQEWRHLLHELAPQVRGEEFTPLLAERLAATSRAGVSAHQLLRAAVQQGPFPIEHAAAALWWRMARHLTPAVSVQVASPNPHDQVDTAWAPQLPGLFGATRAERIKASTWWPALVANVDHGLQRGWQLEVLLSRGPAPPQDDVDECQALVWQTSIALEPIPDEHLQDLPHPDEIPPEDLWEGVEASTRAPVVGNTNDPGLSLPRDQQDPLETSAGDGEALTQPPALAVDDNPGELDILADLRRAELRRGLHGITDLEPTEADLRRAYEWEQQAADCPVPRDRLLQINDLTQGFFEHRLSDSWGRDYLAGRFGFDLTGHEYFRPGQAPTGWTGLVDHLRRRGVGEEEMLAAGVATLSRRGTLIDRFRDRVTFPITKPGTGGGEILGFVGRRHPTAWDSERSGPKYLNTADTSLFRKGKQLFGTLDELLEEGGVPVIVEGPMDAIAVTVATAGAYVGLSSLGTSLTSEQAAQLAAGRRDPIVALDADLAGRIASERSFWMLTPHGMDPGFARFPEGQDPAGLLAQYGPAELAAALRSQGPLGESLIGERVANLSRDDARPAVAQILAAQPGATWAAGLNTVEKELGLTPAQVRRDLRDAVVSWDNDPRNIAQRELAKINTGRARRQPPDLRTPVKRWATLARALDPRLVDQRDWPATAQILQEAHDQGRDVAAAAHDLIADEPLGEHPARELHRRLASRLDLVIYSDEEVSRAKPAAGTLALGNRGPADRRQRPGGAPAR